LRHGNSLATIRYRMSDGLNFVVVDEVEVESSHSRTSNRCSFDKLRAWPVGSDLDYCIRLRTPAPTQLRAKRRSIATAQQGGTRGGAFVGEHGSWDRPRFAGYKVVFVPFSGGRPSGKAEDVVTGFLNSDEKARGRPVGLAVDKSGALLIADDVGNAVWRVTPAGQ
jgi:hypothetical protein